MDPAASPEDLRAIDALIGDARVVALGEATHGTREFALLRHRVFRYLVEAHGITALVIEAPAGQVAAVNDYVLTGQGDPELALAGVGFWVWNTEETLALVRWMSEHNAERPDDQKVSLYGCDPQFPSAGVRRGLQFLRDVDPDYARSVSADLRPLMNPFLLEMVFAPQTVPLRSTLEAIEAHFDRHAVDWSRKGGESAFRHARWYFRVAEQLLELRGAPSQTVRDAAMAENVLWLLEEQGPKARLVVAAHNAHIALSEHEGVVWLGTNLRSAIGDDIVSLAMTFDSGGFRAREFPGDGHLREFTLAGTDSESVEHVLSAAAEPVFLLDLRAAAAGAAVHEWLDTPRPMRSIGATFSDGTSGVGRARALDATYTGLFFVERATATTPLPSGERPGRPRPGPPGNLDFERADADGLPVHWHPLDRAHPSRFDVSSTDERPHSGDRSLLVASRPAARYGDAIGGAYQVVEAEPHRGTTLQLSAFAKLEPATVDTQAFVWIQPRDGNTVSPKQYVEVTGPRWHRFAVDVEVSPRATEIDYGIALVGGGRAWLDGVEIREATAREGE